MIVVHHLNNSRSQRVLWLLEELGVPYEIKPYQRNSETMLAPRELRAVHPLGKSPVITDGDITLAESGAIIEYIVDRYGNGRLAPALASALRVRYIYWLHYAEGSLAFPLLLKLIFDEMPKRSPLLLRPLVGAIAGKIKSGYVMLEVDKHLDYLEAELGKSTWFAGDEFTAADIQMSFPLEIAVIRGGLNASRPKLMAFLERIHQRSAYERAMQRGGEYDLMK